MKIQSRKSAGLPSVPGSVGHRSLSSWTGIKVHHTGGSFSSWRSIYDWQVHNRPASQRLVDIGYSFGVANGRITELRGFGHHPAHDHENSTLGVVFGGNYTSRLPPDEDLQAFAEFVHYAREHTGRPLSVTGHRDTWPRGDGRYSTCPGDRLYGHLPQLRQRIDNEEDDMPIDKDDVRKIWRTDGVVDTPKLTAHGKTRSDSNIESNPFWTPENMLGEIYKNVARVRRKLDDERAKAAAERGAIQELVRGLAASTSVTLTDAQVDQLASAVAAAGDAQAAEVLARLEAAGEALTDDDD